MQAAKAARQAAESALTEYTAGSAGARQSVLKALEAHVLDQKANEQAEKAAWDDAKAAEVRLNRQLANCDVRAPADGIVVHANDAERPFNNRINIANGATVRRAPDHLQDAGHQQPVLRHDSSAQDEYHASQARLESANHSRRQPDRVLAGKISKIAALPDPASVFDSGRSVYTSQISFDNLPPDLVLGMKVRVEIEIANLGNVLTVPADAVITFQDKDHVAVKKSADGLEWREVTLGVSDGVVVEVKKGIQSGDVVIRKPAKLIPLTGRLPISVSPAAPLAKERSPLN